MINKEYIFVFLFSLLCGPLLKYSVIELLIHPGYLIGSIIGIIGYIFLDKRSRKRKHEEYEELLKQSQEAINKIDRISKLYDDAMKKYDDKIKQENE